MFDVVVELTITFSLGLAVLVNLLKGAHELAAAVVGLLCHRLSGARLDDERFEEFEDLEVDVLDGGTSRFHTESHTQ